MNDDLLKDTLRKALASEDAGDAELDAEIIAAAADGTRPLDAEDQKKLAVSRAGRDELAAAVRFTTPAETAEASKPRWLFWAAPLFAAAVAAAVVLVPKQDEYRSRGTVTDMAASVTFLKTNASGTSPLRAQDILRPGDRLGVRYGNPASHKTLTVLGYDGTRIHWVYPGQAGEAAVSIRSGKDAINVRLPEDVVFAPGEIQGSELKLVAAFDVAPERLAAQVRAGDATGGTQLSLRWQEK